MNKREPTTVAVSGGFDPLHIGHIRMFNEAKKLGDELWVFLNSDEFLIKKKGRPFMSFSQRQEIIENIKCVDRVIKVIDKNDTVCHTLRTYVPHIFANGGDRYNHNIPEYDVCKELGIQMIFEVGGEKVESSSKLLNDYGNKK